MTIEQLLCPAVITWERDYKKQLEENHITMTEDEIVEAFDKWLIENEALINKSVEDNREHINEVIKQGMDYADSLNEKLYNDSWEDDDEGDGDKGDDEDEPLDGSVEGENIDPDEPEVARSITGAVKLDNNRQSKYNVFGFINDFYIMVEEEKTFEYKHKNILSKLDVSGVKDMTALFAFTNLPNIDLSSWDTGYVKKMEGMFYKSTFNNDSICKWDVSSCSDFKNMFLFCPFNQSLSAWTPAWVEKRFRNEDGTEEKRSVRADLPILGSTEDENKAMAKIFRRNLFNQFRAEAEEDEEVKENKTTDNTMNHVVDFDTFVNEGKFRDFIDRGVEKVKNFFKGISLKMGKFLAFFKDNGEVYPAISPYTSMQAAAAGLIPGVTAFCAAENEYLEDVEKVADIVPEPGYYGIIKKDSLEYRNYETFKGMVNEHYAKYGDTGALMLNEENFKRVGFSAEEGGVIARDIDSQRLRSLLSDLILNVPAYKGKKHGGVVFIFGAPGIGKSTIPRSIVKAWNEKSGDEFHKKALMVIECGDLTIDGFSLPIPIEKSIEDYLDERPILKDKVAKSGISTDVLEVIKKNMYKVSAEAPKTWLPAFRMNATQEEIKVLNDIANGYLEIKYDDNTGEVIKTETTEGGILLFDEFFRANEEVFKIMMQIVLNRSYSGYMLGNKWGILCCSNRPNDDEEVRKGFEKTGPVVGNRFLAGTYNFIPSFDDWKKWAVTEGGFDDITIAFLMKDKNPKGEYTNWHTIRPDEYTAKGKTTWPTPRAWSGLMTEINNFMENHGYKSIAEIPRDDLKFMADGVIGEEMSDKYVSYVQTMTKNYKAVDVKSLLEDPNYEIPADMKCSEVTKQVNSYIRTVYSSDELPDVQLLINLFKKIDATYSASKDNFTKPMHTDIIKFLKAGPKTPNYEPLKEYLHLVDDRFDLSPADLK